VKIPRRGLLASFLLATAAKATSPSPVQAIAAGIDAIPAGPALLQSYPTPAAPPALRNVAFVYDNALALIALQAAGYRAQASRIGDALLIALDHDRFWHDGRLRNAYRAGAMATPAPLPGFWNPTAKLWSEDAYQVGSASGNVAWAALALCHLRDQRYTDAARRLVSWLGTTAWDRGVIGGFFGEEPNPIRQNWHSTEQNLDAAVVMRLAGDPKAATCFAFVASQFDPVRGPCSPSPTRRRRGADRSPGSAPTTSPRAASAIAKILTACGPKAQPKAPSPSPKPAIMRWRRNYWLR